MEFSAAAVLNSASPSSVSDPFLQDYRGPLPPPPIPATARASAVAQGAGNVLATGRVASLELVDAQTTARAQSSGGLGAIAQADTRFEARGATIVDASSTSLGQGLLHGIAVHAEGGNGIGLRAAATLATDGLIDDPNLDPVDFSVSAREANSPLASTLTASSPERTLSGEVHFITSLAASSDVRGTATYLFDAQLLDPHADFFVRYFTDGPALAQLNLDLVLDGNSLWKSDPNAAPDASLTGNVRTIELGMVGALLVGGDHELQLAFDFLPQGASSGIDFTVSFGTRAPSAVPLPSAIYGFGIALLAVARRRRYVWRRHAAM